MARGRSRYWRLRALVSLGALVVVAAAVWLWPRGQGGSSAGDPPPILTAGKASPDRGETALQPLLTSGKGAGKAGDPPPADSTPPNPKPTRNPMTPPGTRPATSQPARPANPGQADADFQAGLTAREREDLLTARTRLNQALHAGLPPDQAKRAREALTDLAERTLFSRVAVKDDPLVDHHVVQTGDTLGKLAKRFKVSEDSLSEINHLANKDFIREGSRLKILHGPFHAAISKSGHVMHLYLQDVYVRTYRVALGTDGSTPTGRWKVANHQEDPGWTDPRTGKRWHASDPKNPIGEFWIGLEGVEGEAMGQFGYGIHGTIEPESIGQNVSMGCIRLTPDDIARVYKLLVPGESFVTITD